MLLSSLSQHYTAAFHRFTQVISLKAYLHQITCLKCCSTGTQTSAWVNRVQGQVPQQENQEVQSQAHQQARKQEHRQVQNQVHQDVHPSTLTSGAALASLPCHPRNAPIPAPHHSHAAPTPQQPAHAALTPPPRSPHATFTPLPRRPHAGPAVLQRLPTPSSHRHNAAAMQPQRHPHAAARSPQAVLTPRCRQLSRSSHAG